MRKSIWAFLVIVHAVSVSTSPAFSQKKLAQTGFEFLAVGQDARATAMGEAFTAVEASSASLFYNPAGMAGMSSFIDVTLTQNNWIADVKHISGSLALNPARGRYGVVGVSFLAVDYGEFLWTKVADNPQGFEDIQGFPQPSAYMIGIGYAHALTDRFSVGGHIKQVHQDLGKSLIPVGAPSTGGSIQTQTKAYSSSVLAFDFGTLYKTGFKSLTFAMTVRNFSKEIKYEREGFQLPLTFKIGFAMNALDLFMERPELHSLLITVEAVHPRSYPEFVSVGGEYQFMNMLALRAGYVSNHDNRDLTAGFGIRKFGFTFDYSYTPFEVFDDVHRMSARFSL